MYVKTEYGGFTDLNDGTWIGEDKGNGEEGPIIASLAEVEGDLTIDLSTEWKGQLRINTGSQTILIVADSGR